MQIQALLARLPEGSVLSASLGDPSADVYTACFLTTTTQELRGDVLYFGDSTLLPTVIPADEMLNCVLYGSPDASQALGGRANVNVVSLADDADPYACFNALQAYFLEDQRQTAVVRRMLAAHFSNRGLQYLIEEAVLALGNPIVVVDTTYRYIAYHLDGLEADSTQAARVMTAEIENQTVLDNAVAYIREQHIDAKIAELRGPYLHHNEILDCATMTSAVMVRGICVAHVMMMEHAHPFDDLTVECFARLALFVGQEMQKSEIWTSSSGELGAHFLSNLLNDPQPSEAVTRRRMKALNFHPLRALRVICLHAPGEGLGQEQAEQLAGQLRPVLHHSIYTRHHQQLVILMSREGDAFDDRAEQALRDVAALNGLSVGISNAFDRITDVHAAYEQARSAIRYGRQGGGLIDDDGLYHYVDYAFAHALDLAGRKTSLLRLCHPALIRLQSYDERHGGELMDTLYCYLQVAGSTTRAATLLHLHKNTLLYRINRIRELISCDLTSGEDIFQLQLGFRILTSLGLFSPRLSVRRADLRRS